MIFTNLTFRSSCYSLRRRLAIPHSHHQLHLTKSLDKQFSAVANTTSSDMFRHINKSLIPNLTFTQSIKITAPSRLHRQFSYLAKRKPYPFLSRTPCMLAYLKPCVCQQLQPYVHLNPQDPDRDYTKGTLDDPGDEAVPLEDDYLEVGEVAISSDGLLHPETACQSSHLHIRAIIFTNHHSSCAP